MDHREANGPFSDRRALQKLKGMSAKAFTVAAGFLRVSGSSNFLDSTQGVAIKSRTNAGICNLGHTNAVSHLFAVHPQDYEVAAAIIAAAASASCACSKCFNFDSKLKDRHIAKDRPLWCYQRFHSVAQRMQRYSLEPLAMQQVCLALASDVIDERDALPPVVFRGTVLSLQDCKRGMQLQGVVRNMVAFGAFVDVGVDTDGLFPPLCVLLYELQRGAYPLPLFLLRKCFAHAIASTYGLLPGLLHINEIKKSGAFLQVPLPLSPRVRAHVTLAPLRSATQCASSCRMWTLSAAASAWLWKTSMSLVWPGLL